MFSKSLMLRLSLSFLLAYVIWPASFTVTCTTNDVVVAQETLEVCSTTIFVDQDICSKKEARQFEEKSRLLLHLDRERGVWDKRHLRHRLLDSLWAYRSHHELNMIEVDRWRGLHKNTSKNQRKLLEKIVGYTNKLNTNDHLLLKNKQLQDNIVEHALKFYGIQTTELGAHIRQAQEEKRSPEKVSVAQALKHYVRDWSAEGDGERMDAFPCVLNTLLDLFPNRAAPSIKVLLPGSGMGRLGHDINSLGGFEVTLNEWSVYMTVAYRYLESLSAPNSASLHPFIDTWSHHATTSDLQRLVCFPDVPIDSSSVLLVEGDFLTAFHDRTRSFDSIVTLFFIDTARNLLSYFDTIHRLLEPGGVWINFGPLLYGSGPFVQLSLNEIIAVVEGMGFEFLDLGTECGAVTLKGFKVRGKEAAYAFNAKALSKNAYMAQSWAVRKVK